MSGDHALEGEPLADAHVDDRALDRAEHPLRRPIQRASRLCTTGLVVAYFSASWPAAASGAPGASPIGRAVDGTAALNAGRPRRGVEVPAPPQVDHELAEQAERHHLHGHHHQQHAELERRAGADVVAEQLGHAHPGEQQPPRAR